MAADFAMLSVNNKFSTLAVADSQIRHDGPPQNQCSVGVANMANLKLDRKIAALVVI